ncbi:MAG: hypothetical protein JW910_02900 [Anaerolineae bacterium]|nr:hypothetical protein [Anaerolineae bacterium]
MDPLLTAGLVALLCIGLPLLGIVLSLASGLFEVIHGLLEFFFNLLFGGPLAGCGCIVLLVIVVGCCGLVAALVYAATTCGTPDPVRFCTWFGW